MTQALLLGVNLYQSTSIYKSSLDDLFIILKRKKVAICVKRSEKYSEINTQLEGINPFYFGGRDLFCFRRISNCF